MSGSAVSEVSRLAYNYEGFDTCRWIQGKGGAEKLHNESFFTIFYININQRLIEEIHFFKFIGEWWSQNKITVMLRLPLAMKWRFSAWMQIWHTHRGFDLNCCPHISSVSVPLFFAKQTPLLNNNSLIKFCQIIKRHLILFPFIIVIKRHFICILLNLVLTQ